MELSSRVGNDELLNGTFLLKISIVCRLSSCGNSPRQMEEFWKMKRTFDELDAVGVLDKLEKAF